jgi:hypothetical protein
MQVRREAFGEKWRLEPGWPDDGDIVGSIGGLASNI